MVITSKLRRHKVMERAMRALMGNNLPPRFKFKDTYDSIEVPTTHQQHLPSQATLEAKFDELIAEEDVVAPTTQIKADMVVSSNLEVGTSNLFVDTETGNAGIGTDSPAYKLDVHGSSNVGALTATSVSGDGSGLTSLNASNVSSGTLTRPISTTTGTFSGDVGIGTTSPAGKLHLYQSGSATNMIDKRTNISTNDYGQTLNYTHYSSVAQGANRDPDNSRGLWIGNMVDENDLAPSGANFVAFTNSFQFYVVADQTKYDDGLSFISNTDTLKYSDGNFIKAMHIDSGGDVGIGTASPSRKLDVVGGPTKSDGFILGTSNNIYYPGCIYTDPNWGMLFRSAQSSPTIADFVFNSHAGSNMMVIKNGDVGIGTTSPQTKLNVRGSVSTGRNIAREVGTVISYSSQIQSSRGAANIINGDKNFEIHNSDWITANGQRDNAYVVIDLGTAYAVDRLVIYNQNEYSNSMREVKGFKLQGSADNSTWTDVITSECGRSNAHEANPGWSFRIPQNWDDDTEGSSYRYWKFIMTSFHGTDGYGGIMELELYEASNALDDEVSTSSLVAEDVYGETGNFSRGVAIGKGYGGTSTGANRLLVEGNVGIGTTNPGYKLDVQGDINSTGKINMGDYAVVNGHMSSRTLTVGSVTSNYGGGNSWNANTAAILLECTDNTEIAAHDSGTRVSSLMYYEGASTNRITIGRDMGWGTTASVRMYGSQSYPNRPVAVVGKSNGRVYAPNVIVYNNVLYNDGGLYNTSNGRFTAPAGYAGYYLMTYTGLGGSQETSPNTRWRLNGTDLQWGSAHINASPCTSRWGMSCQFIYYLNAGDYLTHRVITASIYGSSSVHSTTVVMFMGSR